MPSKTVHVDLDRSGSVGDGIDSGFAARAAGNPSPCISLAQILESWPTRDWRVRCELRDGTCCPTTWAHELSAVNLLFTHEAYYHYMCYVCVVKMCLSTRNTTARDRKPYNLQPQDVAPSSALSAFLGEQRQ